VSGTQGQPGADTTQVANSLSSQAGDSAGSVPSGQPDSEAAPQTVDASGGTEQSSAAQTDATPGANSNVAPTQPAQGTAAQPGATTSNPSSGGPVSAREKHPQPMKAKTSNQAITLSANVLR